MFAQKLINDVLFEAEMESLSRNFKVVDVGEPQYHFGSIRGNYGFQQYVPPPIGQYQHVPSQIGQYRHTPPQLGQYQQQQQMPETRRNRPSETVRSDEANDYFLNFEENNN